MIRTSGSLDSHNSGADVDFDILWDDQLLFGKDVLHLEQRCGRMVVAEVLKVEWICERSRSEILQIAPGHAKP